jgi:hypothetical protein
MHEDQQESAVRRRQLLRRGATLAAGVAGAGVVGAVTANPAHAAPGDPVVQGANNTAGTSTTTITSTGAGATLELNNNNGAALRLAPGNPPLAAAPEGSISFDGVDYWAKPFPDDFGAAIMHHDLNSNRLVPILPQRLVDTRDAAQRGAIFNTPASAFDASGRLRPGQTMHLNLGALVAIGETVFGNITVTAAAGGGLFTVFPFSTALPPTSTINYPRSSVLSALANFFVCPIGFNASVDDAISVFCSGAAGHVIVDVVGFTVGVGVVLAEGPFGVAAKAEAGTTAARRQAKALARRAQGQ